jgi:hypothetical protein
MPSPKFLRFPVVTAGAEYLVMGSLMRRNILTYKAPPQNEGYDLICIHPDPRHRPRSRELPQVRVQVKSRYQCDSDRAFPVKDISLDAFEFLVVVFLNIGDFYHGRDGSDGMRPVEYYTLSTDFIREHHDSRYSWQKVSLRGIEDEIAAFRDEEGFEQIARALGVPKPTRASSD